jgi:protein O-mannosyl-transferase
LNRYSSFLPSREYCFAGILFFLIILAMYFPAMKSEFLLDDVAHLINSSTTHKLWNPQKIWLSDYWEHKGNSGNYRPLLKQIWAFEVALFGIDNKVGFIFINILLHTLNGLLLLRLLRISSKRKSESSLILPGLFTLLYLVHPIHTEVLVNVVGQGELFTVLFLLSALNLCYNSTGKKRTGSFHLWASCIMIFISLWIKEQALLFPVIFLLFLALEGRSRKELLVAGAALILGLAIYMAVRIQVLGGFSPDTRYAPVNFVSILDRISFIFTVTGRYLFIMIFPLKMSVQYNWIIPLWTGAKWAFPWTVLGIMTFITGLGGFFVFLLKKMYRGAFLLFGIGFMMLPFLHLCRVGSPMAERHLAHAMLFIIMVLCFLTELLSRHFLTSSSRIEFLKKTVLIIFAFILMLLSVRTHFRIRIWHNEQSLWSAEIKRSDKNAFARHNLAVYYFNQGMMDFARQYSDEALMINPKYDGAHITRGQVAISDGQLERAQVHFNYAIRFGVAPWRAHLELAHLLIRKNLPEEAGKEWLKAKAINPELPPLPTHHAK